jgi:hypothetical protein
MYGSGFMFRTGAQKVCRLQADFSFALEPPKSLSHRLDNNILSVTGEPAGKMFATVGRRLIIAPRSAKILSKPRKTYHRVFLFNNIFLLHFMNGLDKHVKLV